MRQFTILIFVLASTNLLADEFTVYAGWKSQLGLLVRGYTEDEVCSKLFEPYAEYSASAYGTDTSGWQDLGKFGGTCLIAYNASHLVSFSWAKVQCDGYYDVDRMKCYDEDVVYKNAGAPQTCGDSIAPTFGNPIYVASGNKIHRETDFRQRRSSLPFEFSRTYNSLPEGWTMGYSRRITYDPAQSTVRLIRDDNRRYTFTWASSTWQSDPDVHFELEHLGSLTAVEGWIVRTPNQRTETYDSQGRLTSIRTPDGANQVTLQYSDGLIHVSDGVGSGFDIYLGTQGLVRQIVTPNADAIRYRWDHLERLTEVVYPDGSSKQYLYEIDKFPRRLTGLVDERGIRYATWRYDAAGRAIGSEHAGGVEQSTLRFDSPTQRTVTNELGHETVYQFDTIHGTYKVTSVSGLASANCPATNAQYTYDPDGNLDRVVDAEGNITDYDFNLRGLEVRRVEGVNTNEERLIETEWHPTLSLPVRVTDPQRITVYQYDAGGRLISKTTTPHTQGS